MDALTEHEAREATSERTMSKEEAEVRLLKYEAEFYRTCNIVRQNGVELHQLKSYLLKELLDLEIGKRKKIHERAVDAISELQVRLSINNFIIEWALFRDKL